LIDVCIYRGIYRVDFPIQGGRGEGKERHATKLRIFFVGYFYPVTGVDTSSPLP
jgi:hypothetical protein